MKRSILIPAAFLVLFAQGARAQDLQWEDIGKGNSDVYCVLADSDNQGVLYLGSNNGLFKSEDNAQSWRRVLALNDRAKKVNQLLQCEGVLYAATGDGLFKSCNAGKSWRRIFKGKNHFENECTSLVVAPYAVYLGTISGLFVSRDNSRTWSKEGGALGGSHVLSLVADPRIPERIYAACVEGVYRRRGPAMNWEKVFAAHPAENGDESESPEEDFDEEKRFSNIRYIIASNDSLRELFLATSGGVYKSTDEGDTWEAVTSYGLLDKDVRVVMHSGRLGLCAATKTGVFRYGGERWEELSFGLVAQEIRSLAGDGKGGIYAACDNGLFRANVKDPGPGVSGGAAGMEQVYLKDEPDILKVQEAAARYAEVEPEKIILWRKQAAKKALLPQVSLGFDRNTTDLWHWESGSTTKSDDDTLRKGDDSLDWDISLSWDLSELIWSNDQTSIDTRSRLLVQLRNDILDEVTKLYFERIRVKIEIDNLGIEDRKRYFEKSLRLRELTASLDALTGGYFSKAAAPKG